MRGFTHLFFVHLNLVIFGMALITPCLGQSRSQADSVAAVRKLHLSALNKTLEGRESLPADSVFKNLQTIGGFEAGLMPVIMEKWSIALGVGCDYCHDTNNWASDAIHEKKTARQMAGPLNEAIRNVLSKIDGLSERPVVNCATCHRGEVKPATRVK
ncbi:MAG TPA: photosynthetic reaction center cytochrome c subunit family protein [bacterium]|nr:photosynthetic reaction center cytochrome c subunit family protein [bacterium]HNC50165.1 photosynthetic reaction center cytochrome c subunit family protein [bacterium]HND77861.1 photosynthetic reaction center cytochrome c subunit family protein [bacterium]HNH31808.1 photosynthetic reaction center cytochrome c subunit family protein [bacterium]